MAPRWIICFPLPCRRPSQSGISLTSGQTYQFNLDLSKYAPQSSGGLTVTFSDGTSSVSQSFSITSSEWTHESWDFVATDTGDYTLTVAATVGTYPTIDDLTLTNYSAVPEPADLGLFIGLAAIGAALKRTRRSRSTRVRGIPGRGL